MFMTRATCDVFSGVGISRAIYFLVVIFGCNLYIPIMTCPGRDMWSRKKCTHASLSSLWFESIPGLIQSTENAIGNHSLLQRGIFNVKL